MHHLFLTEKCGSSFVFVLFFARNSMGILYSKFIYRKKKVKKRMLEYGKKQKKRIFEACMV